MDVETHEQELLQKLLAIPQRVSYEMVAGIMSYYGKNEHPVVQALLELLEYRNAVRKACDGRAQLEKGIPDARP
ncbi:MAG TPA: hypothetical protein VFW94_23435 [Candidatus Acidoferrales bacterium]|nr:hypothetical protein [Candidatus Acidoferrales bacterium]